MRGRQSARLPASDSHDSVCSSLLIGNDDFNGSYPWLSTLPFSRRLLLSSQRQFSCLWSSCWTALVYSLAYSDKLPLIPLNILCGNLQNPENHSFLLPALMLKLYFKNCNRFAFEQKWCFYSYKYSVQLPLTTHPKLQLNQHLSCFTEWQIYYLILLLLLQPISSFWLFLIWGKTEELRLRSGKRRMNMLLLTPKCRCIVLVSVHCMISMYWHNDNLS